MRLVITIVIIILVFLLLAEAVFSLNWPIAHDEAPLLYETFLMRAEGRMPYRDIFDFQMPGTYAIFYGIGLLSNFDPFRIRLLDLFWLAAIIGITLLIMREFGWRPALAAPVLFGLKYLEGGPSMALQREYILLFFIALAILIYMRQPHADEQIPGVGAARIGQAFADSSFIRLGLTGLFMGIAATIKPQAAVGLLPFLYLENANWDPYRIKQNLIHTLTLLVGFFFPALVLALWLAATGSLIAFNEIVFNYWPLYSEVTGQLTIVSGLERWWLIMDQIWRVGGNGIWVLPAIMGVYLAITQSGLTQAAQRRTWLISWLAVSFSFYPALSGQFFQYHYLPFIYFVLILASLSLRDAIKPEWKVGALVIFIVALILHIRPPTAVIQQLAGKSASTASGREEKINSYLASHLKPEDTVQPLDWTGGTLQAMLTSRAHLATSFVFDFYFYHHVDDPFIQELRSRFIKELIEASPAYIVEITAMDKPWIAGPGTSREFPQLRDYLEKAYSVSVQKDDYKIYKRR